jgi:glycosyltransferase involved in cell wall biosynthesis
MPKVTVLMSVYNGERYIREAIDSILIQTFTDYDFLIIEDSSTDNTLKIINGYHDPRIKLVKNEKRIGLIKSLNLGISLSQGEYIARMDADDISCANRFLEEVNFLDNHPDIMVVGTAREEIDEFGIKIMDVIPKKEPNFWDIYNENPFQNSSVMIRKSILLEFGGYNELFPSCEEYALWLLISKKYKMYNLPKILCKLRIHKESLSQKKFEEQTFSHIFAKRMVTDQILDKDMEGIHQFGAGYFKNKLNKGETNYYLNRVANYYRINNNFYEAQKIYRKLFLINPLDFKAIINYFRLFFGKKITDKTTKIYLIIRYRYKNLLDQRQKI